MIKTLIHSFLKIFNKKIININTNEKIAFLDRLKAENSGHRLIKVGPDKDGGYILPQDLEGILACYSPGTGDNIEFEKDLLKQFKIPSFMCDGTIQKLEGLPIGLNFTNKNLGICEDSKNITLEKWIDNNNHNQDLLLQMDIEGAEYSVLLDLKKDYLNKFRILIIEFHNFDFLLNDQFFYIIRDTFNKILENFTIVNINPNNCCGEFEYQKIKVPRVLEFSFLRKDRIKKNQSVVNQNLKIKNISNKKEIIFNNFK